LLLLREQNFLDTLLPEYNILKTAGSMLGHKHSPETIAKLSGVNSHMYGKTGHLNPFFGRTHSDEIKALIGQASKGKILSTETKTKISITKGTAIFVYNLQGSLVNSFSSVKKRRNILIVG
jgi:group I intron endonuclease